MVGVIHYVARGWYCRFDLLDCLNSNFFSAKKAAQWSKHKREILTREWNLKAWSKFYVGIVSNLPKLRAPQILHWTSMAVLYSMLKLTYSCVCDDLKHTSQLETLHTFRYPCANFQIWMYDEVIKFVCTIANHQVCILISCSETVSLTYHQIFQIYSITLRD